MTWRERLGQFIVAGGATAAGAIILRVAIPYPDICDRCTDYYPYWLCVILGCF